jgi:hypothetical protein
MSDAISTKRNTCNPPHDHFYPRGLKGTRCYCGARQWGKLRTEPLTADEQERATAVAREADGAVSSDVHLEPYDIAVSRSKGTMQTEQTTDQTTGDAAGKIDPTKEATLTLRKVSKLGTAMYSRPGIRASVAINARLFSNAPPKSITILGEGFAVPGEVKDAASLQERANKAQERAAKAEARAKKALERAQKLQARLQGHTAVTNVQATDAGTPATPEGALVGATEDSQ